MASTLAEINEEIRAETSFNPEGPAPPAHRWECLAFLEAVKREAAETLPAWLTVDPRVWDQAPWGRRLLVQRLAPDERIGLIHVPETAQREQACGFVVNIGPTVHLNADGSPSVNWNYGHPLNIVGRCIAFSMFAGLPFKTGSHDRDFTGDLQLITTDDILSEVLDLHLEPVEEE